MSTRLITPTLRAIQTSFRLRISLMALLRSFVLLLILRNVFAFEQVLQWSSGPKIISPTPSKWWRSPSLSNQRQ